jgi:hypothetical protein
MSIADVYLAEVGAPSDGWEREHAVAFEQSWRDADPMVREAQLLGYAAAPVIPFMINFMLDLWPGIDVSRDAELTALAASSRRRVVVGREAGIDGGLAELNLAVLDWIDAQIKGRASPEFAALVRERVDGLIDAGRRGRERGLMLRGHARVAEEPTSSSTSTGPLLRRPGDHYFRSARAKTTDHALRGLLDAQIDLLGASYARLAAHVAVDHAGSLVELEVLTPVASGWTEPITTTVLATHTASACVGDRLGLRLVADPGAKSFNGTLISVRGGERWLVCGHRLADGTLVPDDGTRRISA